MTEEDMAAEDMTAEDMTLDDMKLEDVSADDMTLQLLIHYLNYQDTEFQVIQTIIKFRLQFCRHHSNICIVPDTLVGKTPLIKEWAQLW